MNDLSEASLPPVDEREHRRRAAEAAYGALRGQGKLGSHRVLTYRCARRCLLLDVLRFPEPVGIIVHQPRYKLSPTRNAESSSESGREKNTEDGDRRWRSRFYGVDELLNAALTCDHLSHVVISRERIESDATSSRREVLITVADGQPPEFADVVVKDDTPTN